MLPPGKRFTSKPLVCCIVTRFYNLLLTLSMASRHQILLIDAETSTEIPGGSMSGYDTTLYQNMESGTRGTPRGR